MRLEVQKSSLGDIEWLGRHSISTREKICVVLVQAVWPLLEGVRSFPELTTRVQNRAEPSFLR